MKLSIAMATYNGARYIGCQLHSLLWQSRLPDELVICDDHSTDGTVARIERFRSYAPFEVRLSVNDRRLGYAQNFNKALQGCAGDLVFMCDQDDVWLPGKLAAIEREANRDPDGLVFVNDAHIVLDDLSPTGLTKLGQMKMVGFPDTALVMGCCVAARKSLLDNILPIPLEFSAHDRWQVEIAQGLGRKRIVRRPLQMYRRHDSNVSQLRLSREAGPGLFGRYLEKIQKRCGGGDGGQEKALRRHELIRMRTRQWATREKDPALLRDLGRFNRELDEVIASFRDRRELRKLGRISRVFQGARLLKSGTYRQANGCMSYFSDLL